MILQIQQGANNPILRKKSEALKDMKNPEIQRLILDMRETLRNAQGLGLAAPQVGENLRIFVIDKDALKSRNEKSGFLKKLVSRKLPEIYINPEIKTKSKEKELMEEGCLSLPEVWGMVERHKTVEIEAQNEKGKKFKRKAGGLLAQVFQHEMDHLGGILFIDKAKKIFEEKNLPANR